MRVISTRHDGRGRLVRYRQCEAKHRATTREQVIGNKCLSEILPQLSIADFQTSAVCQTEIGD
jgi:hypothetical protein